MNIVQYFTTHNVHNYLLCTTPPTKKKTTPYIVQGQRPRQTSGGIATLGWPTGCLTSWTTTYPAGVCVCVGGGGGGGRGGAFQFIDILVKGNQLL